MRKKVLLLSVLFVSVLCHAQDLVSLMNRYNSASPQEKLYIHFDNSAYTPGQTIFYKAYLQNTNRNTIPSTNLYLDLFDEQGHTLVRLSAPVYGFTASGSYEIPAAYRGNTVRVVAYTKWMLNFDSAWLFQRSLKVIQKEAPVSRNSVAPQTTLGFYPEGGDLVEGVTSVIAFKAVDGNGMPARISGSVFSQDRKTILPFTTTHNGMGRFSLKPIAGERYTAEWKDAAGILHTTALPSAKPSGVVLTMNTFTGTRSLTIERNAVAEEGFKKITLVATINQQVVFRGSANMFTKEKIEVDIPTGRFPSGVLQLTVLDANMMPLAERITFINNNEYIKPVSVVTDTLNLKKKGRNSYHIALPDTLWTSMSLSVTDAQDPQDSTSDIVSCLLLSSDIKGRIIDPSSYFSPATENAAAKLDLVMLTNGWRRFVWSNVLSGSAPALRFAPDLGYISLTGTMSQSKLKKPQMMNVVLKNKNAGQEFVPAEVNTDGSFMLDKIILFDTSLLFYRMNGMNLPKEAEVTIQNHLWQFDARLPAAGISGRAMDTTGDAHIRTLMRSQEDLEQLKRKTTLQEVVVRAKTRTQILNERHTQGMWFRDSARSYSFNVLDDSIGRTKLNVAEYLLNKPIIGVRIAGMPPAVTRTDGGAIDLFVNEMPSSWEEVKGISMDQVAFIKYMMPPFFGTASDKKERAALAIYYINEKDLKDIKTESKLRNQVVVGYSPVKEFYSPAYSESQLAVDDPDLRRTILWQPNIETSGKDTVRFSFFNSDHGRSLLVTLQGISADGKLIHLVKRIGTNPQ